MERLCFSSNNLVVEVFCFFSRVVFVDNGSDCPNCCYRMFCLPDVSAQVYANCAFLHAVVDEVENFPLRFGFWSTCNYHRNRAAFNDFLEFFFAVVCFDYSCAYFS